jgi:hypothetical protein
LQVQDRPRRLRRVVGLSRGCVLVAAPFRCRVGAAGFVRILPALRIRRPCIPRLLRLKQRGATFFPGDAVLGDGLRIDILRLFDLLAPDQLQREPVGVGTEFRGEGDACQRRGGRAGFRRIRTANSLRFR